MAEHELSEKSIFLVAIELTTESDRARYLETACGGNAELRANVEALLRAHDGPQQILDRGAAAPHTIDLPERAEQLGAMIGPYKLLQQIGEGGMGVVYLAQQVQPVQRQVALKVIKRGLDSRQVIARFEAERQALAIMDHVNIARVLDAGTTEAGLPYFVMELVHGVPITKYCDDCHLTPRERLELFVPVCQAIQHAHQKGIIHRDIKPTNVMITLYDGRPVPKVIDFGVAKATEQRLTERTLFTQYGAMIGTFEYMSPEQAEMSALGADIRSDIYSLGVLLYELLTGTTPLSRKRVQEAALADILRMIKEEEPPRPSTRLSDSGAALASVSAQRQMEPAKLTKLLQGELDWIVMKSLEKDRNRRYETASAFAADVRRYLNDESVQACPPSRWYRLRKFVRRNKGSVASGVALFATLSLGIVCTSIGLAWALRAEGTATAAAEAETLQRQNAETQRDKAIAAESRALAEKQRANEEAGIAKAVNDFLLQDLLAEAAPERNARNTKVTVEELLDRAGARIAGKFEKQPRIEAAIRQMIGDTYRALSHYSAAQPHLERSLELRRRVSGEEHADTLIAMNNLANLYHHMGQFVKAEPLYVKTLEVHRRVLGDEHSETLTSMNNLASHYCGQGQFAKAEALHVKTLEVRRRTQGEDHPLTLKSMNNLGELYRLRGQPTKAEKYLVKTLEIRRRVLGDEHPDTLTSMNNLAALCEDQGLTGKAESLYQKAIEIQRRVLGDEHARTLNSMNNLAVLYQAQRQYAKAQLLVIKVLEVRRRVLGDEHPDTLNSAYSLGRLYQAEGLYVKAESLLTEVLESRRRVLGEEHPDTLTAMNSQAVLHWAQRQFAKAEPLYIKTLDARRRVLGPEHADTLNSMHNLAALYQSQRQFLKAESLYIETLATQRRALGDDHPKTLTTIMNLAELYRLTGSFTKAEPLYREALGRVRHRHGKSSRASADALAFLGLNLIQQQKHADAEPLLRECLAICEQSLPDEWPTFNTRSLLGASLLGQKQYANAEPLLVAGYEGMKQRQAAIRQRDLPFLTDALERVVQLYDAWGKKDQADDWRKKLDARRETDKQAANPKEK